MKKKDKDKDEEEFKEDEEDQDDIFDEAMKQLTVSLVRTPPLWFAIPLLIAINEHLLNSFSIVSMALNIRPPIFVWSIFHVANRQLRSTMSLPASGVSL